MPNVGRWVRLACGGTILAVGLALGVGGLRRAWPTLFPHPVAEGTAAYRRGDRMLGVLRSEMNDPPGAAEVIRNALTRDPTAGTGTSPPVKFSKLLARSLLLTGKPAEARGPLMEVLDAGPDAEASWLLSRV